MKRIIIMLAFSCIALAHAQAPTISLVKWSKAHNNFIRYCSGAIVTLPEGNRVVTAGHCVEAQEEFFVRDYDGNIYPATLERNEFNRKQSITDYAVLRSVAAHVLPSIKIATSPPAIGDTLCAWISPLGLAPVLSCGMYAGITESSEGFAGDGMMLVVMSIDHGASGGVLLNERGEAVGIITMMFNAKLMGALIAELPPDV